MPVEPAHTAVCFLICHRQSILGRFLAVLVFCPLWILESVAVAIIHQIISVSGKAIKFMVKFLYFSAQLCKLSQDRSEWRVGPNDIVSYDPASVSVLRGMPKNLTSFYTSLSKCFSSRPWQVSWQAYLIKGKGKSKWEKEKKKKKFWSYF